VSQNLTSVEDPIVVWGGGAIGGTLAAYWARAGVPVLLVDVVPEHVEACRTTGLSIEGSVENFTRRVPAVLPGELKGKYSRFVLAVKATSTEQALAQLMPHLASSGFILLAQNGLNEITIAKHVCPAHTMGCFVNFGADWHEPGRIVYGGRGEVVIGEIEGPAQARTFEMHKLLSIFEPNAIVTENIWGYRWGKLGFAAMLFATSLNNDSLAVNFSDPQRFPVFDQLGREVMAVAHTYNVRPMAFPGFDPIAFMDDSPESEARECIAILSQRRRNGAKQHSGFWRDLAVRKRRTEIDPLMGVVAELGKQAGAKTPAIEILISLVHDVEDGRRALSLDTFNVLLGQCRLRDHTQ
jgi:2-dehydropantoate 2-reductase